MKSKIKIIIVGFIFLIASNNIFSQDIIITVANGKFILDEELQLIVCNNNISEYYNLTNINSLTVDLNGADYNFLNIPNEIEHGEQYQVIHDSQVYQLYFSKLPLININTSYEIQDEPKVLASLLLTDSTNSDAIISYCGIEYRGGFSQSYPKKSFDIELWEDTSGSNTNKLPLLNMREDDDWLLFAMYNEPLRIRNVVNHKLWKDIHTLYYINEEPEAKSGINTQYVELAINNIYQGIYAFCEQMDKKQLKLKKYNTSIRGELYKGINWGGAATFTSLPPYDNSSRMWGGFEMKYPKEEDITDWANIYDFVNFVINSSDSDFEQNIASKFVLDNAIDYFIFLNILRANDNRGKNIFITKYDENEPYFYVPWDLDGTFGIKWDGDQENIYNDLLVNGLYSRLQNSNNVLFNQLASNRWFELRENILQNDNLINRIFQTYNFLLTNGNYERESLKWGDESIKLSNLEYTYEWLENRFNFLDLYFSSTMGIENIVNSNEKYKVLPNPITSTFRVNNYSSKIGTSYSINNINGLSLMNGILHEDGLIDIGNLSSGIYFLRVFDNESKQLAYFKIIKQ